MNRVYNHFSFFSNRREVFVTICNSFFHKNIILLSILYYTITKVNNQGKILDLNSLGIEF
jgi:hypothetical protein